MKGTWSDYEVRNKYYEDRAKHKSNTSSSTREQQQFAGPTYYNKKPYSWEEGKTDPRNIDLLTKITNSMDHYNRERYNGANVSAVFEIYNKRYEKLHAKKNKSIKALKKETELLEKILKRIEHDNDLDNICCCCSIIFIDIPLAIGLSIEDSIVEWKDRLIGSSDTRSGGIFSSANLPVTNIVPTYGTVGNSTQRTQDDTPSTSSGFKHLGYTSWGKAIELDLEGKVGGIMYEQMLATSIRFKVNNNYVVKIEQFRSVMLPDKVNLDVTYKIQLVCSDPDGSKMSVKDAAYLEINYDQNGKLEKMTVPNTPKLSSNPTWSVLTVYHGKVCSLPVSSGTYNWLVQKIQENHGDVVIGHTEDYHLDYLG
ncbi:hypothetical protein [Candidatus Tisiphia endosymbiont of Micropterix aruncella]|uniref:hypothetical protein n=1 Tax=Candidatus Tisiphia endosymbiont of Micropterix aruncella TaxID=3066271 RepID=UPI003AA80C9F